MNDDAPVTRRDFNLMMENMSLKIAAKIVETVEEKLDEFATNIHQANIDRRDTTIREVTGFGYDDKDKIAEAVQYAYKSSAEASATKSEVKKAVIGSGTALTIGGAIAWLASHFGNGN